MKTRRKVIATIATGFLAVPPIGLFAARARSNPYYQGPVSDHFDGKTFFNPNGTPPGNLADLARWRFGNKAAQWPESWPSPFHGARPQARVAAGQLIVTMVGHASLLIQADGLNILTDPVWSPRASPVRFAGPKRVNPPGIAFDDLPPIDLVLVTHNHYDHLDLETLGRLVQRHDPLIHTPLGNDTIIAGALPGARIATGDWGDRADIGPATAIHYVPTHHWSARGMNDRRMALWASFVIETGAGKIYHVGDTGFHDGINFQKAAAEHGPFRLALLPIGAYEPRWFMKGQHMNPDEAVRGMQLCGAQMALGHHWGTFQLTDEAIDAPEAALGAALDRYGVAPDRFPALRPGQSVEVAPATA